MQPPLSEEDEFNKLVGIYRHYCPDWDYMAIDEHCPEFEACLCDWARKGHDVTKTS